METLFQYHPIPIISRPKHGLQTLEPLASEHCTTAAHPCNVVYQEIPTKKTVSGNILIPACCNLWAPTESPMTGAFRGLVSFQQTDSGNFASTNLLQQGHCDHCTKARETGPFGSTRLGVSSLQVSKRTQLHWPVALSNTVCTYRWMPFVSWMDSCQTVPFQCPYGYS